MSSFFSNPELLRNARMQLRPGRMVATAAICAAITATVWTSIVNTDAGNEFGGFHGPGAVFMLVMNIQIVALLIGGGIFCIQSVHRERELNTFDYQRVTRLTAFELAIGKLFGAPIGAYFFVLCLMPVAIAGAIGGAIPALVVLEIYIVLLLGSITFHTLMLLVSVLLKRSGIAISVLVFLMLIGLTSIDPGSNGFWGLHACSPFCANRFLEHRYSGLGVDTYMHLEDSFFGLGLPHILVLLALYGLFTAWFLGATVRNMKQDPSTRQILPPSQLFAFVLTLNVLLLGFTTWEKNTASIESEQVMLVLNTWCFVLLALALLRNRERVRQQVRQLGNRAAGAWAALWPAPWLVVNTILIGGAILGMVAHYRNPQSYWSWPLAIYEIAFLPIWLARDALYLQWMSLRRSKYPLGSAILYQLIYYTCTSIAFGSFSAYSTPKGAALTAVFIPSPFFVLDAKLWVPEARLWIISLAMQGATGLLFAWLHWQELQHFTGARTETGVATESVSQHA